MKSAVSEELRRRQLQDELELSPAERIHRSLEIGRRDLRMFMAANDLSVERALELLREGKEKARKAAWKRRNR